MGRILLVSILILAFFLRVPLLDQYPLGFTPDEASFGYDAYSIIQTGRDQWGKWFPLVLESFGDFKAPLYSYLLLPFVGLFGLETWVVRLPNALLGVGAVAVTYFLVKELLLVLSQSQKSTKLSVSGSELSLFTALLLSISPWHVQLSRGAFEANLTAFLMPLGMLLFIKGVKNPKYLIYSMIVFGVNLFSYHAARVVTPLVIAILVATFFSHIKKVPRKNLFQVSIVFCVFLSLAFFTLIQGGTKRAQDVSIFRGALEAQADDRLRAINNGVSPTIARIQNNKYLIIADRFVDNYTKYFSYQFLINKGAAEATYGMVPGIGVVHPIEIIGFISFIIMLFVKRHRFYILILGCLLISPIPAALTTGVGYAGNRAATMLPFIHIASAIGIVGMLSILKSKLKFRYMLPFVYSVIILFLVASTYSNIKTYLDNQNTVVAKGMLYGRLELVSILENNYPLSKYIISRRLSEPHIYVAFLNSWNPKVYQNNTYDWRRYREDNLTFLDQMYKYSLGKYTFKAIEKSDFDDIVPNTVIVLLPDELPQDASLANVIKYPSGEPAIYIIAQ
jgi:4-amino-4-deoxy-L-arabinose transferase-like glycosyltransferase